MLATGFVLYFSKKAEILAKSYGMCANKLKFNIYLRGFLYLMYKFQKRKTYILG